MTPPALRHDLPPLVLAGRRRAARSCRVAWGWACPRTGWPGRSPPGRGGHDRGGRPAPSPPRPDGARPGTAADKADRSTPPTSTALDREIRAARRDRGGPGADRGQRDARGDRVPRLRPPGLRERRRRDRDGRRPAARPARARRADCPDVALVPILSDARGIELVVKKWARKGRLPDAIVIEHPRHAGGHLGAARLEDLDDPRFDFERCCRRRWRSSVPRASRRDASR